MAIKFNGTTDYLTRAPVVAGSPTSFSVSAWASPATVGAGVAYIYSDKSTASITPTRMTLSRSTAQWDVLVRDDSNNTIQATGGVATVGAWTHVVGTYDATGKTAKLYVNGAQVGTFSNGAVTNTFTTTSLDIGARVNGSTTRTNFWSGAIAHVAVWSGVLPVADITAIWTGAKGVFGVQPEYLIEYWPLSADWPKFARDGLELTWAGSPIPCAGPTCCDRVRARHNPGRLAGALGAPPAVRRGYRRNATLDYLMARRRAAR